MIKVIFINRYFYPDYSATSQILSDLAFYLSEKDLSVEVVCSRLCYNDIDADLPAQETINSVKVKRIWTSRFGRANLLGRSLDYLSFYISAFFILLKLVKPGDIVVAKTDPPMISVVASIICKFKSAKLINWNQDIFPEVGIELGITILNILQHPLCAIRNYSLRYAVMNIVLGDTMRDRLIASGVNDSKISIIPNWSDGEEIYPVDKDSNTLRQKWDLDKKFIVGYSGNMGRAHEFITILSIACELKSDPDIVFLFIGDGAKKQWIENEVKNKKLNNIIFKPYQPRDNLTLSLNVPDVHVISLLPNLEGLIVPSKYYGVAAAGKACLFIGADNGEISRILKKNDCGKSISLGDVQSGVDYILKMKNNQDICRQQGDRARETFLKEFDSKIAYHKWMKLLN